MTADERFLYGNLILKVISDISDIAIPQFCSTLSAPSKNSKTIKRRLCNMMNLKKSRKSMIALSVIAAFMICSLASIYALASNADEYEPIKETEETSATSAVSEAAEGYYEPYEAIEPETEDEMVVGSESDVTVSIVGEGEISGDLEINEGYFEFRQTVGEEAEYDISVSSITRDRDLLAQFEEYEIEWWTAEDMENKIAELINTGAADEEIASYRSLLEQLKDGTFKMGMVTHIENEDYVITSIFFVNN
jgi:hypothetical protein